MKTTRTRSPQRAKSTRQFHRADLTIHKRGGARRVFLLYRADSRLEVTDPEVTNPLEAHYECIADVRHEGPCHLVVDLTRLRASVDVKAIIEFDLQDLALGGWQLEVKSTNDVAGQTTVLERVKNTVRELRTMHPWLVEVGIGLVTLLTLGSLALAKLQ